MNKQEIFDKVYTHLMTQQKRSMDEYGSCKYRGPDGLMCAAGCLIPDSLYSEKIEGLKFDRVSEPHEDRAVLLQKIRIKCGLEDEKNFVRELQQVHDFMFIEVWKSELERIAEVYKLSIPSL